MHSHSRSFQHLLEPQAQAFSYLWLLVEAGQIPPQNLLNSTVWIVFKNSPAGQNIKCFLTCFSYCLHIIFILYRYNDLNFNSISLVLNKRK